MLNKQIKTKLIYIKCCKLFFYTHKWLQTVAWNLKCPGLRRSSPARKTAARRGRLSRLHNTNVPTHWYCYIFKSVGSSCSEPTAIGRGLLNNINRMFHLTYHCQLPAIPYPDTTLVVIWFYICNLNLHKYYLIGSAHLGYLLVQWFSVLYIHMLFFYLWSSFKTLKYKCLITVVKYE